MTKNRLFLIVLFMFLFLSTKPVFASVIINEVQILPTEDRFIELYNTSSEEMDLTGFYIQRKTETGSSFGSLVSSTNFENKKIGPNSYFVISRSSKSFSDIVLSGMTLTESNTLQLKNSSGEVVDVVCFGSATCSGINTKENPKEGQSLQRNENTFLVGIPTPKKENISTSSSSSSSSLDVGAVNTNQTENSALVQSSGSPQNKEIVIQNYIYFKKEIPKIAFANTPVSFFGEALDQNNQKIIYGKYFWNFGDGTGKEFNGGLGQKFTHTYFYTGEYEILLEFYKNPYSSKPDLVEKFMINVVSNDLIISNVGEEKDFFIEILNNGENEINLEGFHLRSVFNNFTFPKSTFLTSKKKIILSPKVTGFSLKDKDSLKILDNTGKIIFDYGDLLEKENNSNISNKPFVSLASGSKNKNSNNFFTSSEEENYETESFVLGANTEETLEKNAKIPSLEKENKNYYFLFFVVLVIFSSVLVFFIRRNKKEKVLGDDFEILEG